MDSVAPLPLADESRVLSRNQNDLNKISDERFMRQLKEIQNLKEFLFEEKVKFDPDQMHTIDLGLLNNLSYVKSGRVPGEEEWKLLDEKISVLASYLSPELRQKIRIRELNIFFGLLPLGFLLATLAAIMYRFLYGGFLTKDTIPFTASFLVTLIVWAVTQGGLGACAYLGTRAAVRHLEKSPLETSTDLADLTDKSVLKIRIILGCLFGALVGVPLGSLALDKIAKAIFTPTDVHLTAADFGLMTLPFIVGFSTNLVLAILQRSIDSIRTFFGIGAN